MKQNRYEFKTILSNKIFFLKKVRSYRAGHKMDPGPLSKKKKKAKQNPTCFFATLTEVLLEKVRVTEPIKLKF